MNEKNIRTFILGGSDYTDIYVDASTYVEAYETALGELEDIMVIQCLVDGTDITLSQDAEEVEKTLNDFDKRYSY